VITVQRVKSAGKTGGRVAAEETVNARTADQQLQRAARHGVRNACAAHALARGGGSHGGAGGSPRRPANGVPPPFPPLIDRQPLSHWSVRQSPSPPTSSKQSPTAAAAEVVFWLTIMIIMIQPKRNKYVCAYSTGARNDMSHVGRIDNCKLIDFN